MFRRRMRYSTVSTVDPKEMQLIELKIYQHRQDVQNQFISAELIPAKGEKKVLAFVGRIDLDGSVGKIKFIDYDYVTRAMRIRLTRAVKVIYYRTKSGYWEVVM